MENPAIALTGIGLLALLCQWTAWRIRLPAILLLLIAGILIGPVGHLLDPDALFGDLLFPLVSLSVAVILFEGSLTLNRKDLRGHGPTVWHLVTWGALLTAVIGAAAAHYILDLSWQMASVLGAVLVVTGPTVVLPLLQTLRAREHLTQILRWEGILIDPIGAIGAVLVYEFVALGYSQGAANGAALHTLLLFGKTLLIGFGLGSLGGYAWGQILRRRWLPPRLHSFGTLMMVFTLFTTSDVLFHESGLLTVTVMGIWLANMRGVPTDEILEFKETLTILLISGLFILLAARLTVEQLALLSWPAWGFLGVLVWVGRPLVVWLCTLRSGLEWREKALLAWLSPRGIVAAAVASLFAIKLGDLGVAGAEMLVPIAFLTIISTVVVQSLLSRPIARMLKVVEPPPSGFLILGANPVARVIGLELQQAGFPVRLTDTDWDAIQTARMAGLPVYYGNLLSRHAEQHMDLSGIGHLLPLSPYRELNTLAALYYANEFAYGKVFQLAETRERSDRHYRDQAVGHLPVLFNENATYTRLQELIKQGAELRSAQLHDEVDLEQYRELHDDKLMALFCIDTNGRIRVANSEIPLEPQPGETLISLVYPESPVFGREEHA
ncbi:cation:proton antiporter [Halomonas sp. M20]|uniref:cation:proton antiporter n=1 Tax=Halomonas sp. M20 TaxID=2763264 RepID=UPI001D09D887|nr:sodium:proton antiporter [Halomonas sp. M20]